jgi:hypothetical protein
MIVNCLLCLLMGIIILYLITNIFLYGKREKFIDNQTKYKNYRLGDIINGHFYKSNKTKFKNYGKLYPNTLAAKYVENVKMKSKKIENFNVLYKIIDINNKTKNGINVHLRVGDVIKNFNNGKYKFHVSLNKKYIYGVQPIVYEKLITKLKEQTSDRNVKIFYGSHNYFNKFTTKYINDVKQVFKNNGFNVTESKSFNPDTDFIEMCNSKIFVQSLGGFSNAVSKIVNINKGQVFFIKDFE